MIIYKTLVNGIVEMMPSDGFRLIKIADRIAAQGSVFLPSIDFSDGWEELPADEADALAKGWETAIESEMEADNE